jgi:5-methyltetrahydropteroyltriglutamate--homocysteine methyltransferase
MITAHADAVGILLRPVALRKARGVLVTRNVTDGEMRRLSFQSQMTEAVDGLGPWDINAFLWGHWRGDGAVGERRRDRPAWAYGHFWR